MVPGRAGRPALPFPEMLSTTAQVQFAAEFIGMLVGAAGLTLVALRPELAGRTRAARPLLAAGFLVLGAVAFGRGSLLVSGAPGALGGLRLAGVVLLVAGTFGWSAGPRSRDVLLVGATGVGAGAVAEVGGVSGQGIDILLAAGSAVLGVALLLAARRSIAARVATSAAATLLLVVLVLSIALSTVITDAVEHDQLDSLGSLAQADGLQVATLHGGALSSAVSLTAALDQRFPVAGKAPLGAAGRGRLLGELRALAPGYAGEVIGFLPAPGPAFGVKGPGGPAGTVAGLLRAGAGVPALAQAVCTADGGLGESTVAVVGGRLDAVAANPVCAPGGAYRYGTVLVVLQPPAGFFAQLRTGLANDGITVIGDARVVAAAGPRPPAAVLAAVTATPDARPKPRLVGGTFVAPEIIGSGTGPHLVLIATSTTASLVSTRDSLFRTLFVIALGGTVLALGLAAITGDRITAGVRRLTDVAQRIQEGRISERAGVVSDDEVGTLAGAFDAMVSSVEEKNAALRDAADDETRLRNRLEAVVAGMGDALVAVDATGRITDFNRAAEDLLGVDAAEAVGREVGTIVTVSGDEAGGLTERLAVPDPAPWVVLVDLARRHGDVVPVALSLGAVRGPLGELTGNVLVLRDLRREQEIERMKTEFLSRVGHELRTPLTGILGYADILLRRDVSAAQARTWHGEILAAAKRQLRIIRLLEFFASSGAGRLALQREPLDVRSLVNGVVATWSDRVGAEHPLAVRVARRVPAVPGDGRWLALALDELIDNAVKFSPGGGRILVRVALAGEGDGSGDPVVEVSVRDHGRGMSDDEQREAFGDFVQGDASDTRSFGGLGLGLSLVQRVVEGHGGEVVCRSAPGRGTTLTMRVPALRTEVVVAP
jgi:PAS domain S-box-containing protein